uniref:Uncharacterized protein n=1 Tax=Tanacetum cinerariifolium TaxID=118510 RepID=A0A6L2N3P9_TANCI|nr:hypothetical protein [Tanacetum cinerariifolium]
MKGKKQKRKNNLRTWKWNEVIDVDSLPDQVEPSNVPKPKTVEPNVLAFEKIIMASFKQKKKDQIKITGTTRLCCLFDEDSSDQEEDLDEDSSDQEENLDEDLSDEEEDLDKDSSDQEEDLDEDSGDQTEDLYEDLSDPDVFYDEDSSDLEEYLRLFDESDQEEDLGEDDSISIWKEDNNNNDIVFNGIIVGEKVVDEIPNATIPVDDDIVGGVFADDEKKKRWLLFCAERDASEWLGNVLGGIMVGRSFWRVASTKRSYEFANKSNPFGHAFIDNRLYALNITSSSGVADNNFRSLVQDLITMLDTYNPLVQSFTMAKDRFVQSSIQPVTLCLIGTRQHTGRQYNLPTTSKVDALIPGDGNPKKSRDVIVEERGNEEDCNGVKQI